MKRRKGISIQRYSCLLVLAAVVAGNTGAQTVGGTILGRMTDPSGAVVPNGKIEIKNRETGLSRPVTTNGSGLYVAPDLAPGTYEVIATAEGFETVVVSGVSLNVGAELAV